MAGSTKNKLNMAAPILWICRNYDKTASLSPHQSLCLAAILDFVIGQKWRHSTLRTVHVYHRAKFCDCTSTGGWVIAFCGKIQNGGVCAKSHRKFGINRTFTFEDMVILKFCKFGLKRLFRPPKFTFLGVLTPKCYFSLLWLPKGTSLAGYTRFEPSLVAVRRAVRLGRWVQNKQESPAVADKPARRLRKVCTVYVRAVGL